MIWKIFISNVWFHITQFKSYKTRGKVINIEQKQFWLFKIRQEGYILHSQITKQSWKCSRRRDAAILVSFLNAAQTPHLTNMRKLGQDLS